MAGLVLRGGLGQAEDAPVCEAADDAAGAEDEGSGASGDAGVVSLLGLEMGGEGLRGWCWGLTVWIRTLELR